MKGHVTTGSKIHLELDVEGVPTELISEPLGLRNGGCVGCRIS